MLGEMIPCSTIEPVPAQYNVSLSGLEIRDLVCLAKKVGVTRRADEDGHSTKNRLQTPIRMIL